MTIPETTHPYRSATAALDTDRLRIPYRGEPRMRLALPTGFANGRITIDPAATDLISIRCGADVRPRLQAWTDEIELSHHVSLRDWLRSMVNPADLDMSIALHPAVEWTLAIRGGLADAVVDLRAGVVARIEVERGCSGVRFELPLPAKEVPFHIAGGASHVLVQRPAETGVAFAAAGGVVKLRLDAEHFDAIGGAVELATRGASPGTARYDLAIRGGASDVVIEPSFQARGAR